MAITWTKQWDGSTDQFTILTAQHIEDIQDDIDNAVVTSVSAANVWTNTQTFTVSSGSNIVVNNTGLGKGIDLNISGGGVGIDLEQSGAANGYTGTQTGNGHSISLTSSHATKATLKLANTGNGAQLNLAGDPTVSSAKDGDFWCDGEAFRYQQGDESASGSITYKLGAVVQQVIYTDNQYSNTVAGSIMPATFDAIPQDTEGVEVMAQTFTPTNINNILKIEVGIQGAAKAAGGGNLFTYALFLDGTVSAIASWQNFQYFHNYSNWHTAVHLMDAAVITELDFRIRIGTDTAAQAIAFNGGNLRSPGGGGAGRVCGGTIYSYIVITEYKPNLIVKTP